MQVQDYIKDKFQSFGIQLSGAEILDLSLNNSFALTDDMSESNLEAVSIAMAGIMPTIMARPDVSEGGFSLRINKEALKSYYSFLCSKYNIENTALNTISDASESW